MHFAKIAFVEKLKRWGNRIDQSCKVLQHSDEDECEWLLKINEDHEDVLAWMDVAASILDCCHKSVFSNTQLWHWTNAGVQL